MARIRLPVLQRVVDELRPESVGAGDRPFRDLDLGKSGSSREILDRVAVAVAGRKIHLRDARSLFERLLDQTHGLEEICPVDGGNEPHARDHVAHGHVGRDLLEVLEPHDLVGGQPLGSDPLREPRECRGLLRIAFPQALQEMDCERGGERLAFEHSQPRLPRFARLGADPEEGVGERLRVLACEAAPDDALCQTTQVLDQD